MATRNAGRPVRVRNVEGIVGGGLFGALLAGGLMNLLEYELIMQFSQVVGVSSHDVAWLVLFGLGIVLAAGFDRLVRILFDPFVRGVIAVTSRASVVRRMLLPGVRRSATGLVCFALGSGFGVGVAVAHLLLVPLWLTYVMGVPTAFPMLDHLGLLAVVGWVVYGSMMGLVYGLIVEA